MYTSNEVLNQVEELLREKGAQLILLISPDKYDMYYLYIVKGNPCELPESLFFEYFASLEKDYLYVDSKGTLSGSMDTLQDLYYYDDSHWSPLAAQLIATEIRKVIQSAGTPILPIEPA